jgi:hypothetical protein
MPIGHPDPVTQSGEPSPWRNLGHYEVLAEDFESAGASWEAVLPSEFTEPVPDWLRAELPDTGWRQITVREGNALANDRQLFAAPVERGWVTALVHPQAEGPPIFMGDLSTYRLRPTQEIRRQGLALSWVSPLRVAASELNAVAATLTNTSDESWTVDEEDYAFVHGHAPPAASSRMARTSTGGSKPRWRLGNLSNYG